MAEARWWQHAAVYQIYPRSFADSNGDGIGDLPGIIAKLDHLRGTPESLGVDAIWLSPFYRSPQVDVGYDVSDYTDVDPAYGTLEDFDRLLAEAHARGLKVIIDLVPSHTSAQHPWFQEARQGRGSPKRDWYVWADPRPDGSPPNNWRSGFPHVGSAWTLDPASGQYYLHSHLPEQPDLNWWNPEVREAIHEVMRFWLDRGVDGFRIDVAHRMVRDAELRSNPLDLGAGCFRRADQDWPEVHEIHRGFRRLLDSYPERMAVGEVYLLDPLQVAGYYGEHGDELHLAFNFSFLWQPWEAEAFRGAVDLFEAVLPPQAWPTWTLSNHDQPRHASRYDQAGRGQARARVAAMMLLTLRGAPFLYYGEEVGMTDGVVPPDRVVDPVGRDPARTPMQWDASPGAGFTTGEPWLPLAPNWHEVNVAAQRSDPASLFSLYRALLRRRARSAALRWGAYRALDPSDQVFAYLRVTQGERLLVALNFSSEPACFTCNGLPARGELALSTDPERPPGPISLQPLTLGADEGVLVDLR